MGEGAPLASEIMQLSRSQEAPLSRQRREEIGVPASGPVAASPEQHTHRRSQASGPRTPNSRAPGRVRGAAGATWTRGEPSLGASRTSELEPGPGWQILSGFPAAEGLDSYIPGAGPGRSHCARRRQRRRRRARPPRLPDCPINKVCCKLPPLGKRRAESGAVELCMTSWLEPACPMPLLFLLLPSRPGWRGWAGHFGAGERPCPRPAAPTSPAERSICIPLSLPLTWGGIKEKMAQAC